jgi:starvation-inducible DNA-binding protein
MKFKKNQKNQSVSQVVDGLSHLLANTYVLYVKTQHFHWNVKGANFYVYHKMFEEQYKELAEAIDKIAERIRSLEALAPASLSAFLKLASLEEATTQLDGQAMVRALLSDHESISKKLLDLFEITHECHDEVTLDLFIERKAIHDKTAWMLRSTLQ